MKRVLVAGATGYLGKYLIEVLKEKGFWVRALVRPQSMGKVKPLWVDEIFPGEVTDADTLEDLCQDMDIVISALGLTRPKKGLGYRDVDFQGNLNLLRQAQAHGVEKFMYIHVLNAGFLSGIAGVQAKQDFVEKLVASPITHQVVCPTGFFSDMTEFQNLAKAGRIYLFGRGEHRINPIHGRDLAEFCVAQLHRPAFFANVGGPQVLTYRQIAATAFASFGKTPYISSLPLWLIRLLLKVLAPWAPAHAIQPLQFLVAVTTQDMVGQPWGNRTLADFYRKRAKTLASNVSNKKSGYHRKPPPTKNLIVKEDQP